MANFNLDRSNTKIGTVFLEVFIISAYILDINMISLEYGRDPVGIWVILFKSSLDCWITQKRYYPWTWWLQKSFGKTSPTSWSSPVEITRSRKVSYRFVSYLVIFSFRYYGDSDEDRLELGRAIYQLEQCLHKCIELRKRKELEISLLQQPIRNWSGDSIEKLGTMRLMTQVYDS